MPRTEQSSLGDWIDRDQLQVFSSTLENEFRRYFLNQWTSTSEHATSSWCMGERRKENTKRIKDHTCIRWIIFQRFNSIG